MGLYVILPSLKYINVTFLTVLCGGLWQSFFPVFVQYSFHTQPSHCNIYKLKVPLGELWLGYHGNLFATQEIASLMLLVQCSALHTVHPSGDFLLLEKGNLGCKTAEDVK